MEKYRINFGVPKETNECVSNGESGGPEYSLSKQSFDTRTSVPNATDMHHVMAFASLYIGDSQTMASEAGVLGVPFVRFNDFVGRIGYLRELEDKYELGYGIRASAEGSVDRLCERVETLVSMPSAERKATFAARRQKMLENKIDCAKFLTYFIENYPQSAEQTRKADANFWKQFK